MILHGFTDGNAVLVSTDPRSGQVTRYPWPRFLEEAKAAREARLAILHRSTVYKTFPSTANEREIAAETETGFVLSIRRLPDPDAILAIAADRDLVIELYRLIPNLAVLTDPAVAARIALNASARPSPGSRVILADVCGEETYLYVYTGEAILKTRPVETGALAREIQQTIGSFAWQWEPGHDCIAITDQNAAREIEEWFGEAIVLPPHATLRGLAEAKAETVQRWVTPRMAQETRARQEQRTRRRLAALAGSGVALAAGVVIYTILHASSIAARVSQATDRITAARTQAATALSQKFPALAQASQPDWQKLLIELALAVPPQVRIDSLKIVRKGGSTWSLEATLEPMVLDERQASRLIETLQENARQLPLLSRAKIEKTVLRTGLGGKMTMQVRGGLLQADRDGPKPLSAAGVL